MTARDTLRWVGTLTAFEGVTLAIGGRQMLRLAQQIGPRWYSAWLRPLGQLPPLALRGLGTLEFLLGLWILAMTPPEPKVVEEVAALTLQPSEVLWRSTLAATAERTFDDVLRESVPPGARVLDLGCGNGDNLARLLRLGLPFGSYLGLDPSPGELAQARARFGGLLKVDFVRNDLYTEQLPTGEFDLIISTWALDRVYDPFELIVLALRQLREGGRALLLYTTRPNGWRATAADLLARLTGRQLRPANLYQGLPSFVAQETFGSGLVSLVVLENKQPLPTPISVSPPEVTEELERERGSPT